MGAVTKFADDTLKCISIKDFSILIQNFTVPSNLIYDGLVRTWWQAIFDTNDVDPIYSNE